MTPLDLAVGFFAVAWCLLTAALILQHLADRDGPLAVVMALFPTVLVLGLSYAEARHGVGSTGLTVLAVAGGIFILAGMAFIKSLRLWRRVRQSAKNETNGM